MDYIFSTYMNVKPLNQGILSCQDYSIRKNEASKNRFNFTSFNLHMVFENNIFLGKSQMVIALDSSLTSLSPIHTVLSYISSPKLYPVLSALSLVVFEYDVQAHPCRLGSLCCVLGQDTLLPKCLTPPGCLNGYQQMLRSTLLWKLG